MQEPQRLQTLLQHLLLHVRLLQQHAACRLEAEDAQGFPAAPGAAASPAIATSAAATSPAIATSAAAASTVTAAAAAAGLRLRC